MIKKYLLLFLCFIFCMVSAVEAQNTWPKVIAASSGEKVTIYEPQPETFTGNKLTGRAAISVRSTPEEEPVFGAIFFTAVLNTDKASRMAEVESLAVTNAKFSGIEDQAQIDKLSTLIQKEAPKWKLTMSIDELVASIKKENISTGNVDFKNDAPKIEYATVPTTLVVLDGEPQIQNDKDLGADKVVNSPYLIFKEGSQWNMYVGGVWYRSTSVTSGWRQNTSLSAKVKTVNDQIKKQEAENNDGKTVTDQPKVTAIIIAKEPTELIQSEGEPDYKTVEGTSLLYVSNSTSEIFKDINSQQTYVLIAGRWYRSPSIKGPWTFVEADKLPADFAKIPEGSDKDGVLANVAGTDAASEALIDAEIPQTAKVDRKTATVKVEYDGAPQFNRIEGTSLQLAENANLTVMIDPAGKYFALDNGVWFIGDSPNGPWIVANDRPRDVENIPASSPAYNSKYVYIYDQTPDYVYTGYTSGYMGGYIYGRTIVYGTGFRYRPWFRRIYYPRPVTWGYGFNYNPWNGWSMNWGFNFGYLFIGYHPAGRRGWGGGWFGPPMYRPPYRPPYWSGGYYGQNSRPRPSYGGGGNRPPGANGPGNNAGRPGSGWSNNTNLYNRHRGVITRDIDRSALINRPDRTAGGDNNRLPGNGNSRPGGRPGNNNGLPDNNNRLPGNNNNLPGNGNNAGRPGNNVGTPGNSNNTGRPGNNSGTPGNNNRLPGNGNTIGQPGNNAGAPGNNNRLPGNNNTLPENNNAGRPATNVGIPPANNNRPVNRDNNVLSDRDGNIFKRDPSNNNWQSRDNRSKDWKPVTDPNNSRVPDLNRQQQSRDRAESRQNNFGRDVPVINRPAQTQPPAARPSPTSRQAPAPRAPVMNRPAPQANRPAPANNGQARPERKGNQ